MSDLSALMTELDEGVDEDTLNSILFDVRRRKREQVRENYWLDLLTHGTDEEIIAAGEKVAGQPVVVLASTYESGSIHPRQELLIGEGLRVYRHPRRPVALRGAVRCWIGSKALSGCYSANGAAIEMFERYLRMSKFTCFTTKDYHTQTDGIAMRIASRMRGRGSITSTFYNHVSHRWGGVEQEPYINGRQVWGLSPSEIGNLRAMYAIIKRTTSLEERMNAVREHRKARMESAT